VADKAFDYVKLANDEDGMHYDLFENDILIAIVFVFFKNEQLSLGN
jgi:hypothetical protein